MIKINYNRNGGFQEPPDWEQLEITADGNYKLWRSVSWTTYPPTPVGRFGGPLPGPLQAALDKAAQPALAAGNLELLPPPDAATETVALNDTTTAMLGTGTEVEGGWGPLLEQLREALGTLTAQPLAAVAVEIANDGRTARLVYRGTEPLFLNLTGLRVRATLWRAGMVAGDWQSDPAPANSANAKIQAGPGWAFDIPLGHGFELDSGSHLIVTVNFQLYQGPVPTAVSLQNA